MKIKLHTVVAILGLATLFPLKALAGSYTVFVGYADSLRPNPNFPQPFSDAKIFKGVLKTPRDAGAIRIHNTSSSNIVLNDLTVTLRPNAGPLVFHLWKFPRNGLILAPGKDAVFSDTSLTEDNFDTSDNGVLGGVAPIDDNCSVGPTSLTPICVDNAPIVSITIDNVKTDYIDTGHVLDTGGFDLAAANPCPVNSDTPGNCNESLQWRPIGTKGIQNLSFGGTATGVNLKSVICENVTTGQKVRITKFKAGPIWDCVSSGLVVNSGDIIKEFFSGSAK